MTPTPIDTEDDPHDEGDATWQRADAFWLEYVIAGGFLLSPGITLLLFRLIVSLEQNRQADNLFFLRIVLEWYLVAALTVAVLATLLAGAFVRRWIRLTPEGLVIATLWSRTSYRDEQVLALGWLRQSHTVPTLPEFGYRLNLTVQTEQGPRQFWLSCPDDPHRVELVVFLNRLTQQIERRAEREGRLEGIGWHLDAEGFHFQGSVTPRERLVARTTDEQYLRLYRDTEWQPFARFKLGDANVRVLARLLERADAPEASHPLGRILFAFPVPQNPGALVVTPFGFGLACVVALVAGLISSSGLLLAFSVLLFFIMVLYTSIIGSVLWFRRGRIDVHERGLCQPHLGRTLRFEHLMAMPVEWPLRPVFVADPGSESQAISFRGLIRLSPHQPEFRFIALAVARRWREQLRAKERVAWTPDVAFHAEGLEVKPVQWLGGGERHFVPYANLEILVKAFSVVIYRGGEAPSLCTVPLHADNYFAGLILLEWLMQPEGAPTEEMLRRWTELPSPETVQRSQ
jgi:hypothetical protein